MHIVKHSLLLLVAITLAGCSTSQARTDRDSLPRPPASHDSTQAPLTLEQMFAQDDFDLPHALLLFSRENAAEFFGAGEQGPELALWHDRFEKYTDELKRSLRRDTSPRQRLLTLIEFVHAKLGLRFDPADPRGYSPENLFFDRVITRRAGYCVTLSLAYIVFGQAAGLNVTAVRIPGHFAVKYVDDQGPEKLITLVESTRQGALLDELEVWSKYRFSVQSVEAGCYLTPLTDKQIFSVLYNNLAGVTHLAGNDTRALERYDYSLRLWPFQPEPLYNRALIQRNLGMSQPALRDLNAAIRIDPNFTHALLARAGVLFEAGETLAARNDLSLALRQRPDWPEPHLLDATLAASEGRFDDARAAFMRALERDPDNKAAHAGLAPIERALGNEEAARKHEAAAR